MRHSQEISDARKQVDVFTTAMGEKLIIASKRDRGALRMFEADRRLMGHAKFWSEAIHNARSGKRGYTCGQRKKSTGTLSVELW